MRKPLPDWGVVFVVLILEVGEVLPMRSSEESTIGEQENAYCLFDERSDEAFFSIKRIIGQSYCYIDNKQHDVGNLGPAYLVEKTASCIDDENKEYGKECAGS